MWGFSHYAKHNCQSCAQNASQIRVVNQYDVRSNNSKAAEKQIPTTSFDQILVRTDFSSTVLVHQSVLQRLLKSSGIDQERRTSISSRSRNDPTKYGRNSPSDSCAITPMAARNPAGGARPDNKGQVKKELKRVGEKLDLLEQRVDRLEVIAEEQDSYRRLRAEDCALLGDVWIGFEQKQIPGNELRERTAAAIEEAIGTQLTRQVDEEAAQRKAQELSRALPALSHSSCYGPILRP